MTDTISLYDFFKKFPDEESARLHFEGKRWKSGVSCAHCGSFSVAECTNHIPMPYRCRDCRKHFSVRTGTVLAESKIPLQKWLMAIYMMTIARKGIPSTQMARELGVTQKSAWFLAQRIRETWMAGQQEPLSGEPVEVDEVYIGGKEKNKHAADKQGLGRGYTGKQPVIGLLQRGGQVIAQPIASNDKYTLQGFVNEHVAKGTTVCTDNFRSYWGLRGFNHQIVNHNVGEFVRDQAHTNGIESFWALLKRGYYGIYHYMSVKHLHRYVNEFAFRHGTSKLSTLDFIGMTIERSVDKRLTYKELTHVA